MQRSYNNTTNGTSGSHTASQANKDGPWTNIIVGAVLIFVGVSIYISIAHSEQNGENVRLPLFLAAIYDLFGKWGVAAITPCIGAWFTFLGVKQLTSRDS